MFLWATRPAPETIRRCLREQADPPLSYPEAGMTRSHASDLPPELRARYRIDRYRVRLGTGPAAFARACEALESWSMFRVGFAELCWPDVRPEPGAVVGVLARTAGLWSLHCCRVVWASEEPGAVHRFGFAYGTLPAHAAAGEERFEIEWHRGEDGGVWYAVLALSRPGHWIGRLGLPAVRVMQRRFARASRAAMVHASRPR